MSGPLSKAPPPPPTPEQRAQRRRQKRLVFGTLFGLLLAVGAWQVFDYITSSSLRAEEEVEAAIRLLVPGHYEEAVERLTRAIQTDPNSWNAYFQRATANQNLGRLDPALEDYEHALLLKPDLPDARSARASIFREMGDTPHAIEELTKAIDIQPTVLGYSGRAQAYAEMGQHELAIADFTWVIEQLRDAPAAYFGRAKSKRALGDEAGATQDETTGWSFKRDFVQ